MERLQSACISGDCWLTDKARQADTSFLLSPLKYPHSIVRGPEMFSVCPSSFSGHHLNAPSLLITRELTAGWNKEIQFVVRLIWCHGAAVRVIKRKLWSSEWWQMSLDWRKAVKMSIGQTLQRNQREIGDGLFERRGRRMTGDRRKSGVCVCMCMCMDSTLKKGPTGSLY